MSLFQIGLKFVNSDRTAKCLGTLSRSESSVSIFHSIPKEIPESTSIALVENNWWNNIKNLANKFIEKFINKSPKKAETIAPNFNKQEAVQLNKLAIRQAKKGCVERTYPKATQEDLRRLTSETIEDSYSRVEYINPKDGKTYNLLKQGETEDGKIVIRILVEEGAFVKEAKITPKKI